MRRLLARRALASIALSVVAVMAPQSAAMAAPWDVQSNQPLNNKPYEWNAPKWPNVNNGACNNLRVVDVVNHTTLDQRFVNNLQYVVNRWNDVAIECHMPILLNLQNGGPGHCGDAGQMWNRIMICGGWTGAAMAVTENFWKWWHPNSGSRAGHYLADRYRITVDNSDPNGSNWWTWTDHQQRVVFCHELGHALGLWHANYSCMDGVANIDTQVVEHPTYNYPGLDSDRNRVRWLYDAM